MSLLQGNIKKEEILSRRDFQEILLARMAGGDLYANELRMKFRRADQLLDVLRPTPLYPGNVRKPNAPVSDNSSPSCHSEERIDKDGLLSESKNL